MLNKSTTHARARGNDAQSLPTCSDSSSTGLQPQTAESGSTDRDLKRKRDDSVERPVRRDYPRHSGLRLPLPRRSSPDAANRLPGNALSDRDVVPYRRLEEQYLQLFSTTMIRCIDTPEEGAFGEVVDVPMDMVDVINTVMDGSTAIGTSGVATCVAVCAQACNNEGQQLLGIYHSSGICPAQDVLAALQNEMVRRGGTDMRIYLVGGMILPNGEGSLEHEAELLSLSNRFPICGARLHLSEGEFNAETGEPNGVNVVLTGDGVYFSKKELYPISDELPFGAGLASAFDEILGTGTGGVSASEATTR